MRIVLLFLTVGILVACGSKKEGALDPPEVSNPLEPPRFSPQQDVYKTPTQKVSPKKFLLFKDDTDFENMHVALERQIDRYKSKNLIGSIELGGESFPLVRVQRSLVRFRELVDQYLQCKSGGKGRDCNSTLNLSLNDEFHIYEPKLNANDPRFGESKNTFFTAYYTPTIEADYKKSKKYPYAIYKKPSTKSSREKSRKSIDFDEALSGNGLEIAYASDLFELYLLHVQGGGKVVIPSSGEEFYISYAGENGKKFAWISDYMIAKKYILDRSVESQREFLKQNPDKWEEIFSTCPSYVYFKKSLLPPEGSDVVPLTDGRSIATDRKHYGFKGLLSYVESKRPVSDTTKKMMPFSRFVLDQDTGGAIKGKARVDFYHGEDRYSENAAYNTKVTGNLYFLILKN